VPRSVRAVLRLCGLVVVLDRVFGLDGVQYEIDLAPANMDAIRPVLDNLAAKGRRIDAKGKTRKASTGSKPATSEASKVREWARANGFTVGDRGRMPAEVTEAYAKAQG